MLDEKMIVYNILSLSPVILTHFNCMIQKCSTIALPFSIQKKMFLTHEHTQ